MANFLNVEKTYCKYFRVIMNIKIMVINMVEDICVAIAYMIIAIHYLHLAIG